MVGFIFGLTYVDVGPNFFIFFPYIIQMNFSRSILIVVFSIPLHAWIRSEDLLIRKHHCAITATTLCRIGISSKYFTDLAPLHH